MFCQHFASSLPLGDRGPESKRFADLTSDTVATFAQTGILAINFLECVPHQSRPNRVHDSAGVD